MEVLFEFLLICDMQVADSSLRSNCDEPDGIRSKFLEGAVGLGCVPELMLEIDWVQTVSSISIKSVSCEVGIGLSAGSLENTSTVNICELRELCEL